MIHRRLSGMGVALVTPFRSDDSIDFEALGNLIEFQLAGGTDFLVICGTTAETPTLTDKEIDEIKNFTVNKVNKRCPIVMGIGGNNTKAVAKKLKESDLSGIDAILSVTPYYNKPTQDGLYYHYKELSEASPLPIILYNVPGRTGVNLLPDTVLRIANELPNVIGVKEASCNVNQANDIIKNKTKEFLVLSGDDESTFPLLALGASGVISVLGNAFPSEFRNMVHLALKGDYENAKSIHQSFTDIIRLLFVEGNPAGIKTILSHLGLIENNLRLPLLPNSSETSKEIRAAITKLKNKG